MVEAVRIGHDPSSPEGENSTYLLPDAGVLVDPGPPGEEAWTTLRSGLDAAGVAPEAIDRIVVTHWHVDHAGLAPRLAEAADATVHMHEDDAPLVGDYAAERERRTERDVARLTGWGAPADVVARVRESDAPSPLPDEYPVRGHADGDRLGPLRLLHTPGHTAGHLAVVAGTELFVGDTVLSTYTPNVGGSDTRMEDALSTYLATLDRLESADENALPGHGRELKLQQQIDAIRRHHEERIENMLDVLDVKETVTPWEVARALFGEMRHIHAKLGAGEAASHLAYMARVGVAERVGRDPVRYVRSQDGPESVALG